MFRIEFYNAIKENKAVPITDYLTLIQFQNADISKIIEKLPIKEIKEKTGIDLSPREIKGFKEKNAMLIANLNKLYQCNITAFKDIMSKLYDARMLSPQNETPQPTPPTQTPQKNSSSQTPSEPAKSGIDFRKLLTPKKDIAPPPTSGMNISTEDEELLNRILSQPPTASTPAPAKKEESKPEKIPEGDIDVKIEEYLQKSSKALILVQMDIKKHFNINPEELPPAELSRILDKICTKNKWKYDKQNGFIKK